MASNKEIEEGKVVAFLAYLLIGIIWYFVDENMKKNSYVKFHVKQGLVLLIFNAVVGVLVGILAMVFGIIVSALAMTSPVMMPIFSIIGLFAWVIFMAIWVVMFILLIMGIVNSLSGKEKELPIIGRFGKKFTF